MRDFVFITDTHIMTSSRVRSGDVASDICNKLRFVVDYCNKNNAILLHGGDVFDKPTVADVTKNEIISILKELKTECYAIAGNHSELWGSPDYNYKTSFNTLTSAGLMKDLDLVDCVEYDDVIITSKLPLKTRNKPQIVINHAFLNIEDGRWTCRFTDLQTTDKTVVLLGHDHVEYEDLKLTEDLKIIRPGSFLRGVRTDTNCRTPKLVHLKVKDGKILTKKVDIQCRDWEEIFKTKEITITKAQQRDTYDAIIKSIRESQKADMTFEQAMSSVAPEEVVNYALKVLEEVNLENNFKKI